MSTDPVEKFAAGVLREGCEQVISVLRKVPLVGDCTWSGVDFRHWHVRFSIRCDEAIAWNVVRRLAWTLNTSALERWQCQPFVFKPDGVESQSDEPSDRTFWILESVVPMLDPKEVAADIEEVLLSKIRSDQDWVEF